MSTWLVIPIAFLGWLVISPIRLALGKPYITPGKLIGWADMNLTAMIAQVLARPFGLMSEFTPWSGVLIGRASSPDYRPLVSAYS